MPDPRKSVEAWRQRLRGWLQTVAFDCNQLGLDLRTSLSRRSANFPASSALQLLARALKPMAVALLKSELRRAAKSLGIGLTDEELDLIAQVIFAEVLS